MSFGTLIEAAFGLVAIYLALSIIVTAANDWVASLSALRSKTLRSFVEAMLGAEGRAALYDDPLIQALGDGGDPQYIPSDMFVRTTVSQWLALADVAEDGKDGLKNALRDIDAASREGRLKPYVAFLEQGVETADDLRLRVGEWFDGVMVAASAAYARKMQVVGFGVGVFVCFALNADTVRFVEAVWTDEAVRAALVAWGEQATAAGTVPPGIPSGLLDTIPLGWTLAEWEALEGFEIVLKLVGLLATSLAVSLGAPFWFEVLNNLRKLKDGKKTS